MTPPTVPKFGVKFPSRHERTVKRVTKCETREIQKRLEPPKPARVRPPPKPKAPKKAKPPATLRKPVQTPRVNIASRSYNRPPRPSSFSKKTPPTSRTLQATDLEKLSRLNCSREFSLFHQSIKSELAKSYENQLGFLQTKLQHLKNDFENKHGEHLNLEQIKEYYNQAVNEHVRRKIKPDEFLTLSEKFQQDIKQAIDKWLRKKEYRPKGQRTVFLQRRHERIRDQIKETIVEQKRQQELATKAPIATESSITITKSVADKKPVTVTIDDDDIMIID